MTLMFLGNGILEPKYKEKTMNNEQFINGCKRTESTVFNIEDNNDERLLHAGIGIVTEAGEFIDAIKKHIFYGKDLDKVNLKEELGDLLWYMSIAIDALDTTFEAEQERVINKLKLRYPEKFTSYDAENRDLDAERAELEKEIPTHKDQGSFDV